MVGSFYDDNIDQMKDGLTELEQLILLVKDIHKLHFNDPPKMDNDKLKKKFKAEILVGLKHRR
jgi:hypothetical protein